MKKAIKQEANKYWRKETNGNLTQRMVSIKTQAERNKGKLHTKDGLNLNTGGDMKQK